MMTFDHQVHLESLKWESYFRTATIGQEEISQPVQFWDPPRLKTYEGRYITREKQLFHIVHINMASLQ